MTTEAKHELREQEPNRDNDRCAYFHESIRMYCGGLRRFHSARYADHEFKEGLVEQLFRPAVVRQSARSESAHSPLPWKMHTFHTMNGETQALNCVGKSMCGRNWTCYVETMDGDSVLETYGATKEEAIANAQLVLSALAAAQE